MLHYDNFKLSKEAEDYAQKLIEEAQKTKEILGGVISKSNIKLSDKLEVIKGEDA